MPRVPKQAVKETSPADVATAIAFRVRRPGGRPITAHEATNLEFMLLYAGWELEADLVGVCRHDKPAMLLEGPLPRDLRARMLAPVVAEIVADGATSPDQIAKEMNERGDQADTTSLWGCRKWSAHFVRLLLKRLGTLGLNPCRATRASPAVRS